MRTIQDITFGVTGQILTFDAPEGRPSSVTSVAVYRWDAEDGATEEAGAVGSGSVESNPNTTTDAAAGFDQADRNLIPLTATTGCTVGRSYLLTSASLEREWVEVVEVASGVSVTAKHPLVNTYASGATFVSTRIQATVDSTWVADIDNLTDHPSPNPAYRVRWEYVVDGVTYVADSYFSLVRYKGAHGVTPQDIEVIAAGWIDRLPIDHIADQGRRLIDDAYRAVKLDLHAAGVDDANLAHSEVLDDLTRWKTIELAEFARFLSTGLSTGTLDAARQMYTTRLDSLVRLATKVPQRDKDGAATLRPVLGITRR